MRLIRNYIRKILMEDAFNFAREAGMLQKSGRLGIKDPSGQMFKADRRKVKDLFRKHADHEWLANNITTVHWVRDVEALPALLGRGKDEISTSMTLVGAPVKWHDYGSVGLWVKGHISLAANSMNDVVSGHHREYKPDAHDWSPDKVSKEKFAQQKASSGINKQPKEINRYTGFGGVEDNEKNREIFRQEYLSKFPYVLDAESWEDAKRFPNEALVDNWQPKGIIIADPDKVEWLKNPDTFFARDVKSIAKEFGIPILDKNFNPILRTMVKK